MIPDVSSQPRCYVCAPFEDGATVRDRVHVRVLAAGFAPSSRWATEWTGSENFDGASVAELRSRAEQNDADLRSSTVALVLARPGGGGEMFAEARLALECGLAVVWVGRRTLSAWRRGVVRVDDLDQAIAVLSRMREAFADGARGELLACLAGVAA